MQFKHKETVTTPHGIDVDKRDSISRVELERAYLSSPGKPVVLTDVVTRWPAFRKWTFDFLSATLGGTEVLALDQLLMSSAGYRMTFRTFADYCLRPERFAGRIESPRPLYVAMEPFCSGSDLLKDLSWPSAIDNLYSRLGDDVYDWYLRHFGVLLVGPAGTLTPNHVDRFGTHAFLAQITGRKRFEFFASPAPLSITGGRRSDPSKEQREPPVYDVAVNPGEMIVFPAGWEHRVTSLDPSISVSFNFVNSTNIEEHLLEIFRQLPAWTKRLNAPQARAGLHIDWTVADLTSGDRAS